MIELDKKGVLIQDGDPAFCIKGTGRYCNNRCAAFERKYNEHVLLDIILHCCKREIEQK